MRRLFWLTAGAVLGAAAYRYYEQNGGRLPILEQFTGRTTDELADEAAATVKTAQRKGQEAVDEGIGHATRQAVTAVAEEIAEAERIKRGHRA